MHARAKAAEDDYDKLRAAHRRTPEAALHAEVARLRAGRAELEASVQRATAEKNKALLEREECRAHAHRDDRGAAGARRACARAWWLCAGDGARKNRALLERGERCAHAHRLARALRRSREKIAGAARAELESLRVEYLAREQRFVLDGDRGELRDIKRELEELRHVSIIQEAGEALAQAAQQQQQQQQRAAAGGAAEASSEAPPWEQLSAAAGGYDDGQGGDSGGGSGDGGGSDAEELKRLVGWREDLQLAGGYDEEHPVMAQLTRRIQLLRHGARPPGGGGGGAAG
ncbi:hypothetical protein JKP88DRAFT_313061 [Tribonema minus]|uniref:Uncharacterized protein n=1 Tax=Tribonema minus TaxID=303371 RepID=A0A835ZA65_9STRA|nr:hypothetical protein JKP88DRAFT_313061 [Tribonema minus]